MTRAKTARKREQPITQVVVPAATGAMLVPAAPGAITEIALNDNSAALVPSREFIDRIAAEVFRGVVAAVQGALRGDAAATSPPTTTTESDVMNADDAAEFLGVDRTTVYDFAGRGVIPHQRLGKRLLFRRGALVAWLDSSLCKATSTRKA